MQCGSGSGLTGGTGIHTGGVGGSGDAPHGVLIWYKVVLQLQYLVCALSTHAPQSPQPQSQLQFQVK